MMLQKVVEKRWWWLVAVCVLAGTLLHLTGYNYGFSYIEEGDEGRLFTNGFALRRGDEFGIGPDLIGYPPLLIELNRLLQPIAERATGRAALLDMWVTIGYIRLMMALLNGATGALLAWTAFRLSGRAAALLVLGGWFLTPVVIETTVLALTESTQNFFYVLAFALSVWTLEKHSRGAAAGSTLAGLGAMLAKYSALPALGFGVGAVLWLMWQADWRRWSPIMLVQAVFIAAIALYIQGGVASLAKGSPEAIAFVSPQVFLKYVDIAAQLQTEFHAAMLIGLSPLLFAGLLITGSILYVMRQGWRGIAWGLLLPGAQAHLLMIVGYIVFPQILFRYIAPILGLLLLLVALAAGETAIWLVRRTGKKWLVYALTALFGLGWLLPVVPRTVAVVYNRTLPDTRAAMGEWSLNVLTTEYNLILSDSVASGRVFSRDKGGYRGLWQHFFEQDFGSRSIEAWREEGYRYAIGTPEFFADAFARQPDTESQILLLKQFPPPNDTRAWRGNPLMFYRLWRMEHETRQRLGETIVLVGYDLEQTDDALILTPYWQAEKLPERNYNVYLHLAPPDSRDIIAQADGIAAFNRLTRTWYDPGETLIGTRFTVPLPPDVSGEYRLLLGMYDYETGGRLLSETGEDFVELARITIE